MHLIIILASVALLGAASMAEGQNRFRDPFSKEEWVTSYRLTMSETDALKFYEEQHGLMALIHDAFETEVTPEPSVKGDSASFEPAYGVGYSLDDLVMLSLLSDETHKKVERLMASMGTWLGVDDEGTRLFWKRRDELAPWVAQRLKEIRGH